MSQDNLTVVNNKRETKTTSDFKIEVSDLNKINNNNNNNNIGYMDNNDTTEPSPLVSKPPPLVSKPTLTLPSTRPLIDTSITDNNDINSHTSTPPDKNPKKKKSKKKDSFKDLMSGIMKPTEDIQHKKDSHQKFIRKNSGGGSFNRGNLDKI